MLAFLEAALQLAPVLIQAGQSTIPLAQKLYAVWQTGADPTDADWQALRDIGAAQTAVIQAPIPGEDDGA